MLADARTQPNRTSLDAPRPALQNGYTALMWAAKKGHTAIVEALRDIPPAVSKTVKKVIQAMKDMFFQETHDNIRNALSISFQEILDYCFSPTRTYGKS